MKMSSFAVLSFLFSLNFFLSNASAVEIDKGIAGSVEFFYSPTAEAHKPIANAIDQAKQSIKMKIYHLTDPLVVTALKSAASRGVDVRIIFDKGQWRKSSDQKVVQDLQAAGAKVLQATSGFSITHEKSMIVDDQKALISTMNQVKTFMVMLDYGVLLTDASIIAEMNSVYEADWLNAQNNTKETPALNHPLLVWSPVNSMNKIVNLIESAKNEIHLTVENLGNSQVADALGKAAARGVKVKVMVPKCDIGMPSYNQPYVVALRKANVDAKMLPGPATTEIPYVHAKSIVVDSQVVFIGSENFSNNSLNAAREVGVIVPDAATAVAVKNIFESLWSKAELPPADTHYVCIPLVPGDGSVEP